MQSDDCELFVPGFDLAAFRMMAAKYVKLLISARLSCEPEFLPSAQLQRWGVEPRNKDMVRASQYMILAARTLGYLNREFLPRCGSGGVELTDETTPEGRLIFKISFLAKWWGGNPGHNQELFKAAGELREGKKIDWAEIVQWCELPAIRDDLDQLPLPSYSTQGLLGDATEIPNQETSYLDIVVYEGERAIARQGYPDKVDLSRSDVLWELFLCFFKNTTDFTTREQLNTLWEEKFDEPCVCVNTIDKQVSSLRKHLESLGIRIETKWKKRRMVGDA